jgi:gliding motility associated protien GldN
MKTYLYFKVIFLFISFSCGTVMGQGIENLYKQGYNGAFVKSITAERKPAFLPGVREADILWSKTVWRTVDLREKMNQPFYFPKDNRQGNLNLVNLLLKAIEKNQIIAFDASQPAGDEFSLPISFDQIKIKMGASTKFANVTDANSNIQRDTTYEVGMQTTEVKQLIVKEIWYFDKQKSSLQVRIIGICPIRLNILNDEGHTEKPYPIFWVFYPDIRSLLAKSESYNMYNGSQNLSWDDLFLMRRFDGYIVREENVYGNRGILEYSKGELAAKESERIKNAIFNYEQDLWEY